VKADGPAIAVGIQGSAEIEEEDGRLAHAFPEKVEAASAFLMPAPALALR
jgi:hypothetical protein